MMIDGLQMNNFLFENNDYSAVRSLPGFKEATKTSRKERVAFKFIDLRPVHVSEFLRQRMQPLAKSNLLHLINMLSTI